MRFGTADAVADPLLGHALELAAALRGCFDLARQQSLAISAAGGQTVPRVAASMGSAATVARHGHLVEREQLICRGRGGKVGESHCQPKQDYDRRNAQPIAEADFHTSTHGSDNDASQATHVRTRRMCLLTTGGRNVDVALLAQPRARNHT